MNVLLITGGFLPHTIGGGPLSVLNLGVGLADVGNDVSILAMGPRDGRLRLRGIDVFYVGQGRTNPVLLPFNTYWSSYRMIRSLRKLLRHGNFDVMHANFIMNLNFPSAELSSVLTLVGPGLFCPFGNYLCIDEDHSMSCGLLKTVHCARRFLSERGRLTAKGEIWATPHSLFAYISLRERNRAIRNFDAYLAISEYAKNSFVKNAKFNPARTYVIPPAIDEQMFENEPEPPAKSDKTVLFVGRLEPEKGVRTLLESIPIVLQEIPDCRFIIVGDGTLKNDVVNFVKQYGLESRVHIEGEVPYEKLPGYYKMSDVVVVPSIWQEAFGMVIVDAMLSRRPVVATKVGGIPELVRDGDNGLLIKPNDRKALADAILDILNNLDLGTEMGERGYEWAKGRFDMETVAKRVLKVYEEILA